MIGNLIKGLGGLLYVQIWKKRIRVTDAGSRKRSEEMPLIAIESDAKGQRVVAVGQRARGLRGPHIREINPFDHHRVAFEDFAAAEKLLRALFEKNRSGKFTLFAPRVIIHPMEKFEGGLTDIEKQALKELALSAGAREAVVCEGAELSMNGVDFEALKRKGD